MDRRVTEGRLLPTLASLTCCFIFLVTLVNAYELEDIANTFRRDNFIVQRVFGNGYQSGDKPDDAIPAEPSDVHTVEEHVANIQSTIQPEEVKVMIDLSVPNQKSHLASYTILSETWELLAGARFKYSATPVPATLYAGEKLTVSIGDSYGNIAHCRLPDEARQGWQHYLEVGHDLEEGDDVNIISYDANFSTTNPHGLLCTYDVVSADEEDLGLRDLFSEENDFSESSDAEETTDSTDDEDLGLRGLFGDDESEESRNDSSESRF